MGPLTTALIAAILLAPAPVDDEPPPSPYGHAIAHAREDLDAGRLDEAEAALAAAAEADRGFEFDWLTASLRARRDGREPPAVGLLEIPDEPTRYGVTCPKSLRVAFICRDGSARIADLRRPEAGYRVVSPADRPEGDDGALWSAAWSADGSTLALGDGSGRVHVYDATTWEPRAKARIGEDWPVRELDIAPDGSAFVGEAEDGLVLWGVAEGRKLGVVGERYNFGEGLAFSPKGDRIASGGMFDILLFDARTAEKGREIQYASYTMGLAFGPDGRRVACGTRGNVSRLVGVFDAETGEQVFSRQVSAEYALGLAFSPDGRRLAVTGCDGKVRLLDARTGEVLLALDRPDCAVKPAFSADGRTLAWSEPKGVAYLSLPPAEGGGR